MHLKSVTPVKIKKFELFCTSNHLHYTCRWWKKELSLIQLDEKQWLTWYWGAWGGRGWLAKRGRKAEVQGSSAFTIIYLDRIYKDCDEEICWVVDTLLSRSKQNTGSKWNLRANKSELVLPGADEKHCNTHTSEKKRDSDSLHMDVKKAADDITDKADFCHPSAQVKQQLHIHMAQTTTSFFPPNAKNLVWKIFSHAALI